MKRKIHSLVFIFMFLSLVSCGEDTTQLADSEFSKYQNGENEVVLMIDYYNLYFDNHILKLNDIDSTLHSQTIMFYEDNIYYISYERPNGDLQSILISIKCCDYYGNNITTIFLKKVNVKNFNDLDEKIINNTYYIEYKIDNVFFIDAYDVTTGEYKCIASGKDCSLSDYEEEVKYKYYIEVIKNTSPEKHGKFVLTNLETNETITIDDEFLNNTIYIESMKKFNYGPSRVDVSNGHILLSYGISAGDGWNYSYLIFEYDFLTNSIEYKALVFPYDTVPVEIFYLE